MVSIPSLFGRGGHLSGQLKEQIVELLHDITTASLLPALLILPDIVSDANLDQLVRLMIAIRARRLGSYYRMDGKDYELSDDNKVLKIPRHGIAIVRTYEWINMPGFLVGRWNLKVKMVYKGLVWVGSLQVDPGYRGYLFCPLYNLSDKEQELIYKDPLFTIDFVRTTLFDESKGCELWKPQTDRPVDY